MEYDGSIRVNLNNIPSYEINTESIKRLKEITAKMEKTISVAFNNESMKRSMEMLNLAVDECLAKVSSTLRQYNFDDIFKGLQFQLDEMADTIGLKNMEMLQNIDFPRLFQDSFYRKKYDEASQMAFEYVEEEVKSEEDISQEELLEIFNEQIEDNVGWQEKLYNKSQEFQRKYYVFYNIVIGFFKLLIGLIITSSLEFGASYAWGKITAEPKKDSTDIYYFDQRTEINIINETSNHYLILFVDDDGNIVTGYSEKENVEIIPKDDEVGTESE